MHNRMTEYSMLALMALFAGGCAGDDPAADATAAGAAGRQAAASEVQLPVTDDQPSDRGSAPAIGLEAVDYEGLQQFLASHRGHPIVLDVWSTSCEPCIKELPNLAAVHQDYRDRGVVCATLNIDYTGAADTTPRDAKDAALPVLQALGVFAHNLYSTVPDRELFKQELFRNNRLYAPPAILVFDKSGAVVEAIGEAEGDASPYEKVRATVESLLESAHPAG